MVSERQLQEKLQEYKEKKLTRAPYNQEYGFYETVQKGNVSYLKEWYQKTKLHETNGLGTLSENSVRSILYHTVISIAMVSRYCIEGGMPAEVAYSLSDLYIQAADKCKTIEELDRLNSEMAMDYCKRMRMLQKQHVYSRHVVMIMEYVAEHIKEKITVQDLSELTGLHENYISRLFKKETGQKLMTYVLDKRVDLAAHDLKHSQMSVAEIAEEYNFSSESYFIYVFKNRKQMTPVKYRDDYYHRYLINDLKKMKTSNESNMNGE